MGITFIAVFLISILTILCTAIADSSTDDEKEETQYDWVQK